MTVFRWSNAAGWLERGVCGQAGVLTVRHLLSRGEIANAWLRLSIAFTFWRVSWNNKATGGANKRVGVCVSASISCSGTSVRLF